MSSVEMEISGRIAWQLVNPDGTIAAQGEQSNLILNTGLDAFANNTDAQFTVFRQFLGIGTDGTLPTVLQTNLLAAVQARNSSDGGFTSEAINSYIAVPASNVWRGEFTVVKCVTLTANTNIAEFALFTNFSGGVASIREVPRNQNGDPTVITALTGQIFKLNHTLRIDVPYNQTARHFTIAGAGVQNGTECWFRDSVNTTWGQISDIFSMLAPAQGALVKPITNASPVTPTTSPIFVFADNLTQNASAIAYTTGSYQRIKRCIMPASSFVGNHGGWAFLWGTIGQGRSAGYKFVLSSGNYNKLNTKELRLDFTVSWSRAP